MDLCDYLAGPPKSQSGNCLLKAIYIVTIAGPLGGYYLYHKPQSNHCWNYIIDLTKITVGEPNVRSVDPFDESILHFLPWPPPP